MSSSSSVDSSNPHHAVSYSTRSCRSCSAEMVAGIDRRGSRRWTCPGCGRTEH